MTNVECQPYTGVLNEPLRPEKSGNMRSVIETNWSFPMNTLAIITYSVKRIISKKKWLNSRSLPLQLNTNKLLINSFIYMLELARTIELIYVCINVSFSKILIVLPIRYKDLCVCTKVINRGY